MGCKVACDHYATAIEILGQGVQTRVFSEVLTQLATFLRGGACVFRKKLQEESKGLSIDSPHRHR